MSRGCSLTDPVAYRNALWCRLQSVGNVSKPGLKSWGISALGLADDGMVGATLSELQQLRHETAPKSARNTALWLANAVKEFQTSPDTIGLGETDSVRFDRF